MKLIFATANKNKLREASEILTDYEIISPASLGINEDIEETGATLEENSQIKARYIYAKTSTPCFADDTGLEVDALNGGPGVMTARYSGENATYESNMDKLLAELAALGDVVRTARFRTVVTLILSDGSEYQFEGKVEGHIALAKSGAGGFGYDPVFVPDYLDGGKANINGLSLADISEEAKNEISHRALALEAMKGFLDHCE